eukprot:4414302-Amphidinium_carterae.1
MASSSCAALASKLHHEDRCVLHVTMAHLRVRTMCGMRVVNVWSQNCLHTAVERRWIRTCTGMRQWRLWPCGVRFTALQT